MPALHPPKPVTMRRNLAAIRYGVSASWIAKKQRDGELSYVKLNKQAANSPVFVNVHELEKLIAPVEPTPGVKPVAKRKKREKLEP